MLIARLNKEIYVNALDKQIEKSTPLYCPSCEQRVFLKKGKHKVAHFAHFSKKDCNCFSEGETKEHLLGKETLFNILKHQGYDVRLEAYLPELKQRPDILVKFNDQSIAIEYQCSLLPINKMIERTENYLRHGYKPFWILGKNFMVNQHMTVSKKSFIQYTPCIGFFLIHYTIDLNKLVVLCDFSQTNASRMHHNKKYLPLKALDQVLQKKFDSRFVKNKKRNVQKNLFVEYRMIQEKARKSSQQVRPFISKLYAHNESIVTMPIEPLFSIKDDWLIQMLPYEWKYAFLRWIESQVKGKIITRKDIIGYIEEKTRQRELVIGSMPMINNEEILSIFIDYMTILETSGIVKEIASKKWMFQSKATRFSNEEEKIRCLEQLS